MRLRTELASSHFIDHLTTHAHACMLCTPFVTEGAHLSLLLTEQRLQHLGQGRAGSGVNFHDTAPAPKTNKVDIHT